MVTRITLFFTLLCIHVYALLGQDLPTLTLPYQTIDLQTRYSSVLITDMCFDSTGYLYIATKEGLLIYDNNRMRILSHSNADTTSLADNEINAITPINGNQIALATGSGLQIFNSITGNFSTRLQLTTKQQSTAAFKYIEYTSDNRLWAANETDIIVYHLPTRQSQSVTLPLINNEYILNLHTDQHTVYVVTTEHLYTINTGSWKTKPVQLSIPIGRITSSAITAKHILILAESGIFYRFDKATGNLIAQIPVSNNVTLYGAYPIIPVNEKETWIFSSLNQVHTVIKNDTALFQLALNNIGKDFYAKSVLSAPHGDLFIGGINDIKLIPAPVFKSKNIPFERTKKTMEKRLPKNIVVKNNHIYSINRNWNMFDFNLQTDKQEVVIEYPEMAKSLLMPVTYIQPVNDTCYLTGFANNKLPQSNISNTLPVNNKLSYFNYYNPFTNRYTNADFNTGFFDKTKRKNGYYAFNASPEAIYFIDNREITVHYYLTQQTTQYYFDIDTSIYSNLFYYIQSDNNHQFWAASINDFSNPQKPKVGCIIKFDPISGKTNCFPATSTGDSTFASAIVLDMEFNQHSVFLLNTAGFYQLNIAQGSFINYTSGNQLPENTYVSMELDAKQNIWAGTLTNGIIVYNTSQNAWIQINGSQNLLSDDMIVQASTTYQNDIYFWSMQGINIFSPNEINFNLPKPVALISDILVRGKSVVLNRLIATGTSYSFNHTQNDIDFAFSALFFDEADKNNYTYMLEGVDEKWIFSENRNYASYHNLAPGNYTFLVKAKNIYGIWSATPASVQIVITPAFWQTTWFKLLCTLLVTAIIYWIYKLRLERALAVEKMRTRISRDLHDDLGSTLSSISILSNQVKSKLEKQPDAVAPLLDKINESSIKMNDSLQDLVWAVKPENDTLQELLVRMEQFASGILESKNIEYSFTGPETVTAIKLNPEFIRNVYLIFKEAVNNAAKYSRCTMVTMVIKEKSRQFNLTVLDNGIGFNPETVKRGNGLNNMTKRATQIGGSLKIISEPGKQNGVILECKITS